MRNMIPGAILAILAAAGPMPAASQNTGGVTFESPSTQKPPRAQPPVHHPYYVYVAPKDDRTPRQKCMDDEIARLGDKLSQLDRAAIDLKCSQR